MIDVDKTYDQESGISLDEHRQREFAKIEQPGFGAKKAKPIQPVEDNDTIETDNDEVTP